MERQKSLHLYEQILLLALRDEKGSIHFGVHYQFALAGAILSELLLMKKVSIEHERKKKFIKLENYTRLGDEILDEAVLKLRDAKRRQQVQAWVTKISNIKQLKHRAARSLCRKGILRMEEDKVLLLFKRKLYPELNPKPEKEILKKMEEAIFTDIEDIDSETLVLISICQSTDMLKTLFDRKLLKGRKQRIRDIVEGNIVGNATKEAIEAIQAAILVAVIIPAVTVTATS